MLAIFSMHMLFFFVPVLLFLLPLILILLSQVAKIYIEREEYFAFVKDQTLRVPCYYPLINHLHRPIYPSQFE